jgi:hypothetical protein
MGKFFHNKKELIFWIIGITIFALIIFYVSRSMSFLANRASKAFGGDLSKSEEIVKFNLDKAKQLKR